MKREREEREDSLQRDRDGILEYGKGTWNIYYDSTYLKASRAYRVELIKKV